MVRRRFCARLALLLVVAAGVAGRAHNANAASESWLYRVTFDPAAPLVARVEVELPATRQGSSFAVRPRGATMNVPSQIAFVGCNGAPVMANSDGVLQIDGPSCARLSWQVRFKEAPAAGISAAEQASWYDPRTRLWLFSDPASLLRPVDAGNTHEGEVEFVGGGAVSGGETGSAPQRRRVPGGAFAPEFYAIGNAPVSTVRQGQADLVYVNALGVSLAQLFGQHRRGLRYLMRATGVKFERQFRTTVVWLPIDKAREEIGGAAGYRTVLVNGVVERGELARAEYALLTLLHEQFHQLTQVGLPLWANESLAQYYAIKALRERDLPKDAIQEVERRFIDPMRRTGFTLRQIQERVQQKNDTAHYGALYSDGATFWDRVDRAIQRHSAGFRSLDSALPTILAAKWEDDRIPLEVLELLHRYGGRGNIEALIERYVGK